MSKDVKKLLLIVAVFLLGYFMPVDDTIAWLRKQISILPRETSSEAFPDGIQARLMAG